MSYSFIKWSILLSPALMVGLWEYVRHEYLLQFISMDAGNWLSPLIVIFFTLIFSTPLFRKLEKIQEELKQERAYKAMMEERQNISQELHDGISQSLFLLSVKVNKLEKKVTDEQLPEVHKIKQTVQHIYEDIRTSIQNLRTPPLEIEQIYLYQSLKSLLKEIKTESDIKVHLDWDFPERSLNYKEKLELLSIMKEALMNVRKHSQCSNLHISAKEQDLKLVCKIKDDGIGYHPTNNTGQHHGVRIMNDRARSIGWNFNIESNHSGTLLSIVKGG
ncbi:sensor histidine kinase [Bacillus sp. DNRA2]|uniref:sensor histidine kinase n=1 Tax=Bacillus sp. DNRA2 TaxID=2723053 RepID=UPI00145CD2DC|nr:histidine kinase [Bacillus sp. DNRA2]NMD72106.1 sensor histidine kinase [Bacillus sp. DNRA2]